MYVFCFCFLFAVYGIWEDLGAWKILLRDMPMLCLQILEFARMTETSRSANIFQRLDVAPNCIKDFIYQPKVRPANFYSLTIRILTTTLIIITITTTNKQVIVIVIVSVIVIAIALLLLSQDFFHSLLKGCLSQAVFHSVFL